MHKLLLSRSSARIVVVTEPVPRLRFPDTHTHLQEAEFDADREEVIRRAENSGIVRILVVGSDLESSRKAIDLAQRYEPVYAAVGIHPHEANRFADEAAAVEALLGEARVVAVGEIGLDFARPGPSREVQIEAFGAQFGWAAAHRLPVSVHNRSADQEILEFARGAEVDVILHCFSGSKGFGEAAIESGCFVSFAGNLTFPKAEHLREVAGTLPLDRLLVETDAPVLAPQSHRGRRNEPAYASITLETLASARQIPVADMAAAVRETADRIFSWNMP